MGQRNTATRKKHGCWKFYHKDGELWAIAHYDEGKLIGLQIEDMNSSVYAKTETFITEDGTHYNISGRHYERIASMFKEMGCFDLKRFAEQVGFREVFWPFEDN